MKRLLIIVLFVGGLSSLFVQRALAQRDTFATASGKTAKEIKKTKTYTLKLEFGQDDPKQKDSTKQVAVHKGRFVGGITFSKVDLGLTKLVDNNSFTMSPENEFLNDYEGKSRTFSFDIVQMGYRFNQHLKVFVAGGFDWTHIFLRKDITIQKNTPELSYLEEDIHFSKNRFSSSYVHIPLYLELRTSENKKGERFWFIVGPDISFLLNGKVKQISEERGKQKFYDDYNFQVFRYGGSLRFGYNGIGLFTKVYFNDMFASAAQKGLTNMSFGLTFGLN
jgi:hypothetical protein